MVTRVTEALALTATHAKETIAKRLLRMEIVPLRHQVVAFVHTMPNVSKPAAVTSVRRKKDTNAPDLTAQMESILYGR